jgi:hypothetical protein
MTIMNPIGIFFFGALVLTSACELMPRNTIRDCRDQCSDIGKPKACMEFCNCIHLKGEALNKCLDEYDKAKEDSSRVR